ncbi:hypothetical protein DY000_02061336 [Brassica cretica]|uniref:Replication protein A 70 kDa DNA-binding subunit B/D first OB fold domain-containing protein n=1 Tax=Brassica cretica TaxID=69181 RepID=A0ABQ7AUL6_BRACR|nr:hypothetical protein DY000_02061336 [Brassica cretica]
MDTILSCSSYSQIRPVIITNKTGVQIIHCTCKRLFLARVQKLQVGQWRFIENFTLTAAAGKLCLCKGVKIIHCTCKRLFLARVQKLQVGQWRFIENFALTAAAGKYQPTSHKYKMAIIRQVQTTNPLILPQLK